MSTHGDEELNDNKKNYKIITAKVIAVIAICAVAYIFRINFLFIIAYLIAGYNILISAIKNILHGEIFDENFLMSIASIGAICIGEYCEAVCVMILYETGEFIQDSAVDKSKNSIKELVKIMPEYANTEKDGQLIKTAPEEIETGSIIVVKAGERVCLDGEIIDGSAYIDTSSITGESILKHVQAGDKILSGCINTDGVLKIRTEKPYKESVAVKIINLVENAAQKKAKTEKFITKFAKIYTPVVVIMAILIAIIPVFVYSASPKLWIERALTFLVISCPCAFVISVPLTFFAGIGKASKSGILIKGSNFIEQLSKTSTVVFDKTGTITKGYFTVTEINPMPITEKDELIETAAYAEFYSNHPIAKAIKDYFNKNIEQNKISNFNEKAGEGVEIELCGNKIQLNNIKPENNMPDNAGITVYIYINNEYVGNIVISDKIKENAQEAIKKLKELNIKTAILTGDSDKNAKSTANQTGIDEYYPQLLPQDKVEKIENIMSKSKGTTIFTGDGINDAPVLTRSDIGIAMGALGSDAAIEAADVVISDDNLLKIPLAIKISKQTMLIVKQNIIFALAVKILFLILGAMGIMTMWGAVFADVGVTLIAVLNSLRTLKIIAV